MVSTAMRIPVVDDREQYSHWAILQVLLKKSQPPTQGVQDLSNHGFPIEFGQRIEALKRREELNY